MECLKDEGRGGGAAEEGAGLERRLLVVEGDAGGAGHAEEEADGELRAVGEQHSAPVAYAHLPAHGDGDRPMRTL